MDTDTKVWENRLRRIADRRGFVVRKHKQRDHFATDYGKYALSMQDEPQGDFVIKDIDIGQLDTVLNMNFNADDFYNEPATYRQLIEEKLAETTEEAAF